MSSFFKHWFGNPEDASRAGSDGGAVRDVAALAAPLVVPAVHVTKTDAPSRSHFGGSPNLPPDVAWPEHEGKRLEFLARVSLAELRDAHAIDWLPDTGALLFFYDLDKQAWGYDPEDRGSWSVLLVPDLPAPVAEQHADPGEPGSTLPHRGCAFTRVDVLPSMDRESVVRLALRSAEWDQYDELASAPFRNEPRHQISGFPSTVQNDDMELECQLASNGVYCGGPRAQPDPREDALAPGAANWRLLFQIESDDDLGVMWGDAGIIYYWVEAHEAREGRFENAWLVLQCH